MGDLPVDIENSKVAAMLEKNDSWFQCTTRFRLDTPTAVWTLPCFHCNTFRIRAHQRKVPCSKWQTKHYPHLLSAGKSVALPGMMLQWKPLLDRAILVVIPTQYAAQMLIESFVTFRKWERCQLQLRTGADKDDCFVEGKTKISVVTYGMLWKWLTSDSADYNRLLKRYKGFLLDEFAIVPPSDKNGGMQVPQQVECAHIISKLVLWNPGTTRLIVTQQLCRKNTC